MSEGLTKQQLAYKEMQEKLKKDIRPMIVKANGYNPDNDQYKDWEHQPYPTWVHTKNADGSTKSVIANNKQEHDALLGRKAEAAKPATVDIAQLVTQPEQVAVKRGRPPKAKVQPLPANLE